MADDFYTNIEARHRNPNGYGLTNGFMCQATIEWSSCSNMWGYIALRSINNRERKIHRHSLSVIDAIFYFLCDRPLLILWVTSPCQQTKPNIPLLVVYWQHYWQTQAILKGILILYQTIFRYNSASVISNEAITITGESLKTMRCLSIMFTPPLIRWMENR